MVEDEYKYEIQYTSKIKKDLKLAKRRGFNLEEFESAVKILAKGKELPPRYEDHSLKGKWKNHRECHIRSDWLLIYHIENDVLVLELTRTGTHGDLFGK